MANCHRITYTIIDTVKGRHVVDTQFYNEANFFFYLGYNYHVEANYSNGQKALFYPTPAYRTIKRSK